MARIGIGQCIDLWRGRLIGCINVRGACSQNQAVSAEIRQGCQQLSIGRVELPRDCLQIPGFGRSFTQKQQSLELDDRIDVAHHQILHGASQYHLDRSVSAKIWQERPFKPECGGCQRRRRVPLSI